MKYQVCILLALAVLAFANEKPKDKVDEERSFIGTSSFNFTTFTLIKYSTTITSTLTSTTTCTTSTAALSVCSAGRRRRGLFYDDGEAQGRNRRGLFYNDEEVENKDGSVLIAKPSEDPAVEVQPQPSSVDTTLIPLEVQAGFSLPEGVGNRFLLAFGTTTRTSFTLTTSTSSITATCSSTTNFPTCAAGTGK